jgi:hypothetical protein
MLAPTLRSFYSQTRLQKARSFDNYSRIFRNWNQSRKTCYWGTEIGARSVTHAGQRILLQRRITMHQRVIDYHAIIQTMEKNVATRIRWCAARLKHRSVSFSVLTGLPGPLQRRNCYHAIRFSGIFEISLRNSVFSSLFIPPISRSGTSNDEVALAPEYVAIVFPLSDSAEPTRGGSIANTQPSILRSLYSRLVSAKSAILSFFVS